MTPPPTDAVNTADAADAVFERHRRRLRALAYRMLGTRGEAEDMVQEAWLRWRATDPAQVQDPLAYLCRTTTHLCLDALGSARARREQYVGLWLPEPLVDAALDEVDGPEATLGRRQQVSLGFVLALQHLAPPERAAFLLHDVFEQDFDAIAQTLGRSVAACRQLASRARRHLQAQGFDPDAPPPPAPDDAGHQALLGALAQAVLGGDVDGLARLLADDVRLYSDGGGVVSAVPRPLDGRARVAQALVGFARQWQRAPGAQARPPVRPVRVNGQPGMLVWDAAGRLEGVFAVDCDAAGRVRGVYIQRNPQKLAAVTAAPR